MTDADLIRSIQAGSETALETLYREYLPSVWRFAYAQLCGNIHAAEDVVSETFLAAVRAIGQLDPLGGSVGGWLIGIARHKVGDFRRKAVRVKNDPFAADPPAGPREKTDPAAPLETGETRAQVAAVLDGLPDDERLALEWKYVDDLSVREIAARLGRSEKAVEAVLYRGRNAFRTAFERTQRLST